MPSDEPLVVATQTNRQVLGACWFVYGILRIAVAIWLVLFSGTVTLMFGALLTRVPNPFALMADFHIIFWCAICLFVLGGVFGILAGVALLANQSAARFLSLVASFLNACDLPIGVTLAVYTMVVMAPLHRTTRVAAG